MWPGIKSHIIEWKTGFYRFRK